MAAVIMITDQTLIANGPIHISIALWICIMNMKAQTIGLIADAIIASGQRSYLIISKLIS